VLEHGRRLGRLLETVDGRRERGVARDLDPEPFLDALNRDRCLRADAPFVALVPAPSRAETALEAPRPVGRAARGAAKEASRLDDLNGGTAGDARRTRRRVASQASRRDCSMPRAPG
jgi:hypothetical protein